MTPEELDALDGVLRRLEEPWLPPSPDESVHYGYEPLGLAEFLAGLEVCAAHTQGRRFLDLGCGIGRSMLLALLMGWDVTGVEHHRPYAEVARRLVPEATVVEREAEEFEGYAAFDVVYSFRLCVEDEDQRGLERLIVSRMRPGSIVFLGHRVLTTPIAGQSLGENCWRV